MKQYIKSLPHHPKRVIIISLVIALAIGIFGYEKINEQILPTLVTDNSTISTNSDSSPSQDLTLAFLAGGKIESVSVKAGAKVSKGTVLATLNSGNTKGALEQAQAAYEKIINGATGSTIDVAKAAVNTAQVNLDETTKQQNTLVGNAENTLLNSTPMALVIGDNTGYEIGR